MSRSTSIVPRTVPPWIDASYPPMSLSDWPTRSGTRSRIRHSCRACCWRETAAASPSSNGMLNRGTRNPAVPDNCTRDRSCSENGQALMIAYSRRSRSVDGGTSSTLRGFRPSATRPPTSARKIRSCDASNGMLMKTSDGATAGVRKDRDLLLAAAALVCGTRGPRRPDRQRRRSAGGAALPEGENGPPAGLLEEAANGRDIGGGPAVLPHGCRERERRCD